MTGQRTLIFRLNQVGRLKINYQAWTQPKSEPCANYMGIVEPPKQPESSIGQPIY